MTYSVLSLSAKHTGFHKEGKEFVQNVSEKQLSPVNTLAFRSKLHVRKKKKKEGKGTN